MLKSCSMEEGLVQFERDDINFAATFHYILYFCNCFVWCETGSELE